jgi:hypothetical protein
MMLAAGVGKPMDFRKAAALATAGYKACSLSQIDAARPTTIRQHDSSRSGAFR